jgi:acetyl-CoA carboxylase carboxyl transferase subunit alpha
MVNLFRRELTPVQIVKRSREDRFMAREIIDGIFTDFFELHGDRYAGDDESIIGGLANLNGRPVTVIAIDKGTDINDKLAKRNGSPEPYGYRKATRLMKQAAKFGRPIITFVNTPGAFPGKTAEDQGQGDAIAQSILESLKLPVPMIAIIYGEVVLVVHYHWQQLIKFGCSKMQRIQFFHQKGLLQFFGKMLSVMMKRLQ